MMQVNPDVQIVVYALCAGAGLIGAFVASGLLMRSREPVALVAAIVLAAWFAIANTIAVAPLIAGHATSDAPVELVGVRVVVPLLLGALAITFVPSLRRLTEDPAIQPAVIAVQTYRAVGGTFLLLLALGALPAIFAVPAGTGDVLIGLTAIATSRSLRAGRLGAVITWNLLGLLDLVIALTVGVLAAPGLLQLIQSTPSTAAVTTLPIVLIPTFAVPLAVLLHAISLRSVLARRAVALKMAPAN